MTIRFAHRVGAATSGGTTASPTHFLRTVFTNNGQYGVTSGGSFVVVEDSELSWNNIANFRQTKSGGGCGGYWDAGASKFVLANQGNAASPSLVIRNVESHHNIGDGGWTDVRNQFVSVHDSHFHHNERHGYVHEIGCDIEFYANELDHNGTALKNDDMTGYGLWISDSNNGDVHDNNVHDNVGGGIGLNWQTVPHRSVGARVPGLRQRSELRRGHEQGPEEQRRSLEHDLLVHGRTGELGPDTLAQRGNSFVGNAYHVPDTSSGKWWIDSTEESWSAWQGAGNDASGSAVTPCGP